MKNFITKNNSKFYTLLSFGAILCLWKILSLFFSPLVLPPIATVAKTLWSIFSSPALLKMIGITIVRLFFGLTIGVLIGLIAGISMGISKVIKRLFYPVIHLFQTIPPVSWVVMALIWFGFNGKPAIFIVIISTIPIIAIHVSEGILHIDRRLVEMADLYQFSSKKKLRAIIIPSILPYFNAAFMVALGSSWKITVMGEVLTTGDGIGGMIKLARLNLEPEYVIAWSVIIVLLFYVSHALHRIIQKKEGLNAKGS